MSGRSQERRFHPADVMEVIVEEDKGGLSPENLIRPRQLVAPEPCAGACSPMPPGRARAESANAAVG